MNFYFYDLETSSGSPRTGRVMQFAGQRTNEDLEPIGEPDNLLVKLADDILPEPDAILVHKITPQQTLSDGISEAEFAEFFYEKVALKDTVFVGYNNIRFDDEFMRAVCFRTFHDPYEWHWKDGRGRWDLLDAIRMMRALRPDGMEWPFIDGKPTVKLEEMAKANGLLHENAHDALSDVLALIALASKFKNAQPKLFNYLLSARDKKGVAKIVEAGEPFVYTSGKY
ncbi:MAG: exodeoxyribonuclease I, partial [Candidatus Saccharibacteria bacterium]|nr:exodeoxyribonuclease I [Candidatus Saccharibacteria bacterium]